MDCSKQAYLKIGERVDAVTTGFGAEGGGTVALGVAGTYNVSTPLPLQNDPVYGERPVTHYGGLGIGGLYGGIGGGVSYVLSQYSWK